MKITQLLKTWLTANAGVAEDADDAEFRRSAAEALTKDAGTDGSLEHEEFVKLTADEQAPAAGALGVKMDQVIEGLAGLATAMTPAGIVERASAAAEATVVAPEPQSVSALSKTIAELGGTDVSVDPAASVRVKGAEEGYSSTKGAMHYPALTNKNRPHPFAGQPVSESERSIDTASDRDKAVAGVWAKFAIQTSLKNSKALAWASMNEHDKGLLMYALHNEKWGGVVNPSHDMNDTEVNNRKLTPA